MRRSKGFTLIELLAVIVILAIIALIATPIILNIINDSREKSNQRSVDGLKKATETTIGEIMMNEKYTGSDIVCKNTEYMSDTEKDYITDIKAKETYCWDIGNPKDTIKQVTYSGSRVVASTISFDKETGEIVVVGAQVGSSSKTYTTESDDSLIGTVASLATDDNSDWLFIDSYGNIRYRGANPNNYITFNNESWRIIGIVDGNIKIIKNGIMRENLFDLGFNDNWAESDLVKLLNPGYEDSPYNASLYWNSNSGETRVDYQEQLNIIVDYSDIGLKQAAREMILKTSWYLGGIIDVGDYTLLTMDEVYEQERGISDSSSSVKIWNGYVGLMNPSDYGYAAGTNCKSDFKNYSTCKSYNWISQIQGRAGVTSDIGNHGWLLNPNINSDANFAEVVEIRGGNVNGSDILDNRNNWTPAVYLKLNVKITNLDSADGSETKPYKLSM